MQKIFLGTVIFLLSQMAIAQGVAPYYEIHQEYTSTRALGMGNAFVAVVDDHSALFYNPAALALRKDSQLRLFLRAGLDSDVIPFYNKIKDADGSDQLANQTAIDSAIEQNYGEHLYFRAPTIGAVLVRPHWGLAIIPVDLDVDFGLERSVGASVFVNAFLDSTVAWGYGNTVKVPWFNHKKYPVQLGTTVKFIHRAYYSDVVQDAQLADNEPLVDLSNAMEGSTIDMDIGALYQIPVSENAKFKPTLGATVRNVADYGFPIKTRWLNPNALPPPRLQRRLDVGVKVGLPNWWVFDPKIALDIRDISYTTWTPLKGLHAGAELYWKMYNWWKGHWNVGINQGYWTAGVGARMAIFQLDIASWGEEVGTSGAPEESRRYILEASLDF
jgi:hypothetical protein